MVTRKRITPDTVVWSEGLTIQGMLVSKGDASFNGNPRGKYILEKQEGGRIVVLGSKLLDQDMEQIGVGEMVEITYIGEEKTSSGQRIKLWEVFRIEKEA